MGEKERHGDARRVLRAEPFVGNPGVRPYREAMLGKLVVQGQQAILEPGALDLHMKVLEADLQELLVGQRGPGKFLAHPCANLQTEAPMVSRRAGGDNRRSRPWRATRQANFPCEGELAMVVLARRRQRWHANGFGNMNDTIKDPELGGDDLLAFEIADEA